MMAGCDRRTKAHGVITASAIMRRRSPSARLGEVADRRQRQKQRRILKSMRYAVLAAKCCCTALILMKRKRKLLNPAQQQVRVPPFDHPMVIAGRGTLALEPFQQDSHLDRAPCAGCRRRPGGGRSGTDQTIDAANQSYRRRREDSACLKAALEAGHPVGSPALGCLLKA